MKNYAYYLQNSVSLGSDCQQLLFNSTIYMLLPLSNFQQICFFPIAW